VEKAEVNGLGALVAIAISSESRDNEKGRRIFLRDGLGEITSFAPMIDNNSAALTQVLRHHGLYSVGKEGARGEG